MLEVGRVFHESLVNVEDRLNMYFETNQRSYDKIKQYTGFEVMYKYDEFKVEIIFHDDSSIVIDEPEVRNILKNIYKIESDKVFLDFEDDMVYMLKLN